MVHSELIKICAGTGVFPSNMDLRKLGRNDLCCQITKRGGFVLWSKKLGFERNYSDSDFGWDGESKAIEILLSKGFNPEKSNSIKAPFDLIVNGCLRVDVKTAKFATYGRSSGEPDSSGWFYRIGKYIQSDVLMLVQMDTGDCYLMPWNLCPTSNITITKTGKTYAKFKNNFELLSALVATRESELTLYSSMKIKWGKTK